MRTQKTRERASLTERAGDDSFRGGGKPPKRSDPLESGTQSGHNLLRIGTKTTRTNRVVSAAETRMDTGFLGQEFDRVGRGLGHLHFPANHRPRACRGSFR